MTAEYLYMCFIDLLGSEQRKMNGPDYIQKNNFILFYEEKKNRALYLLDRPKLHC